MNLTFDQIIGGIEDGIIVVLQAAVGVAPDNESGYVKTITSYGGEMETQSVEEALSTLTPRMPAMFVAYGQGDDALNPPTQPAQKGEPRHYRHDCGFTVVCISADARGEKARRRGAVGIYRMMSDVKLAVGGLQFKATIGQESKIVNPEPMRYDGVQQISRMKDLTAYAVNFQTWFRYSEPDRTQPGQLVQELIFDVVNTFELGDPPNLPGVSLQ